MTETTTTSEEKTLKATSGFDEIKAETTKLFRLLGNAVSVTFLEVTNRLLVYLDHETRRHLDLLIEYGIVQDRQEAIAFLIAEGIQTNRPLLKKIEHANARVASLQIQLRALNFENETL